MQGNKWLWQVSKIFTRGIAFRRGRNFLGEAWITLLPTMHPVRGEGLIMRSTSQVKVSFLVRILPIRHVFIFQQLLFLTFSIVFMELCQHIFYPCSSESSFSVPPLSIKPYIYLDCYLHFQRYGKAFKTRNFLFLKQFASFSAVIFNISQATQVNQFSCDIIFHMFYVL